MAPGTSSWTSLPLMFLELTILFQRMTTRTLHYPSFDEALTLVARYGQKALLAKLHIKQAFCLCPVRLEDRGLLGIHWQGKFYIAFRLPFGLRSSPLFNRIADAFEWLLKTNYGIQGLKHYLDDYFTVGPCQLIFLCPQRQDHPPRGLSDGHTPCPQ